MLHWACGGCFNVDFFGTSSEVSVGLGVLEQAGTALSSPGTDLSAFAGLFAALKRI